ncbi:coiled-coil and C2 domain-containing protein 2A isoform X1 [Procambarus clarkii]|uniref:coiled-coil and C2 domain-containing protein 2A isoform X1 n=1 Tax=Procambarus clarkii TaxID=6728 RepID=UPI003742BB98
MLTKLEDIERQDEDGTIRFIPASTRLQLGKQDENLSQPGVAGPSGGERERPGRLRKKLTARPFTRFDEAKAASRIESHDFFTRIWPEDQPLPTPLGKQRTKLSPKHPPGVLHGKYGSKSTRSPREGSAREDTGEDAIDDEESEMSALVASRMQLVTRTVPATYVSYHERCANDEATLFVPSMLPSDVQNKINADTELRNLEDEGLFVGAKPYITPTNINIIENRLLQQGDRHWFSETGSLERLDNPISDQFYRHLPTDLETQEEPLAVFVGPRPSECLQTMSPDDGGVLDVELAQLTFTHHPLFSPEHVSASQLTQAYNTYVERAAAGVTKILQNKLLVLRQSLAKLRQIKPNSRRQYKSVNEEIDSVRRLEIYRQEIRDCREEFNTEAERDRILLANILKIWKNIKHVRRSNKYYSTSLKLIIRKENVNKEDEEERRKEELEEEFKELLEEYEEDYEKKMKKYEKEMTEWKATHKKKKEAKKRQQKRQKSVLDEDFEGSLLQAAQDETILSSPEAAKPQPPKPIDKQKVQLEVLEVFSRTRRPPGEPILQLELSQSSSVTDNNLCPEPEKRRRQAAGKNRVWVKVLINNKLVTQTPSASFGNDFTMHIGQTYRMALSSWPRHITLEVMEGASLRQTLVASAFLPVPSRTNICKDIFTSVDFSGTQVVSHNHEGVGCGLLESEYGSSLTCGMIRYRLGWARGEEGEILAPAGPSPAALSSHSPLKSHLHPRADPAIIKKWLKNARIDPNDPSNASLVNHLKKAAEGKSKSTNYFEIDNFEGEFCTEADLDSNVRLRVLQLRAEDVPEFRGLRLVPAIESEVLRKTLEKYESKTSMGTETEATEAEREHLWGLDQRWERVENLLASLRRHMQQRYAQASSAPKLEDLVREESIPDIGTLGTSLLSVFKARRPLKPERKKRDRVRGVGLGDQNVQLIVHIARAFHVPVRDESQRSNPLQQGQSIDVIEGNSLVRPFVEATFQRSVLRTSVAEGPNPTWNQQLSFRFRAPNDNFSPSNLHTVRDNVYLHLFDEVIHDLLEDDRLRDSTVYHRIEKRWLGSLKIPFSTIYSNAKIEGTFSLEEPVVLLGYTRDAASPHNLGAPASQGVPNRSTTHLSIYITLEPTLPPPEHLKAQFESSEPEEVLAASRDWVASLSSRYSHRSYRTHVLDLSGKLVCLHRFIRPLHPPEELIGENLVETAHRVAWYVSLIPSLADMTLFPGACDIWANSEQFLTMLTGDEEEHAVLLTNFFLHLGKAAFLLLGSGIPEGETCYVLTGEENGTWLVWNPSTAQCFGARDAFSPLSAVYMLANQDNIWANVQKYDDPPRVNFDVQGSGWRPFFSRSQPDPGLPSVQPQRLLFPKVNTDQMEQLKERLEITLRDAIMKWRSTQRTPWNRHAISVLRKLVQGLEEPRATGRVTSPDLTQLSTIMSSHKILQVCGVCVHQGYSTMASVVEAVHSTGVHLTQAPEAEFALAIHLKSYPASIISVWVYVASLVKRV